MFSSYALSIWRSSRKVGFTALHRVEVDKMAMAFKLDKEKQGSLQLENPLC